MLTESQKRAAQRYRERNKAQLAERAREQNKNYQAKNKEQIAVWRKEWYANTKDERNRTAANWRKTASAKSGILRREYGITLDQYNLLIEAQNNQCGICSGPFTEDSPHVDHCHISGQVRGLLCGKCNRGLGLFDDNVDLLSRAIAYLSRQRDSNPHLSP